LKILQLSDLHLIGENSNSLYGICPYNRLQKALKSIEEWHSDADFIVLTGDLTDDASSGAYTLLEKTIQESSIPIYPILGNHDKRDVFSDYFPEYLTDGFIQYTKKIDNKIFIFLDTLVEDNPYGELCEVRMKWFADRLEEYRENSIYIFMHHHPIDSGLHEMDNMANFKSSKIFWHLLKRYDNVKHISFGHIHRIMHSFKNGVSLHSTRSTTFQVAYRPDSKAEFLTNEENPTYAILESMEDDSLRVHHHEFMNEDRLYIGDC